MALSSVSASAWFASDRVWHLASAAASTAFSDSSRRAVPSSPAFTAARAPFASCATLSVSRRDFEALVTAA